MIKFYCTCGKRFKTQKRYAGKSTKCDACGKVVFVPFASESKLPTSPPKLKKPPASKKPRVSRTPRRPCPTCGAPTLFTAVICTHCKQFIHDDIGVEIEAPPRRAKESAGVTPPPVRKPNTDIISASQRATKADSSQATPINLPSVGLFFKELANNLNEQRLKEANKPKQQKEQEAYNSALAGCLLVLGGGMLMMVGCPLIMIGSALSGAGSSLSGSSYSPSSYSSSYTPSSSYSSSSSYSDSSDLLQSLSSDSASSFADNYDNASYEARRRVDAQLQESIGVSGDDLRHLTRQLEKMGDR